MCFYVFVCLHVFTYHVCICLCINNMTLLHTHTRTHTHTHSLMAPGRVRGLLEASLLTLLLERCVCVCVCVCVYVCVEGVFGMCLHTKVIGGVLFAGTMIGPK